MGQTLEQKYPHDFHPISRENVFNYRAEVASRIDYNWATQVSFMQPDRDIKSVEPDLKVIKYKLDLIVRQHLFVFQSDMFAMRAVMEACPGIDTRHNVFSTLRSYYKDVFRNAKHDWLYVRLYVGRHG